MRKASGKLSLVWDAWLWIALGGPLLFGGYFVRSGKVEWAQLLVPTCITAVMYAYSFKRRIQSRDISFVRVSIWLWRNWSARLEQAPFRTFVKACGLVGLWYALTACIRHWMFESASEDLGIFFHTLWNFTHGHGYQTSLKGGISLFADHQSPILWAFAPLVALLPKAEVLIIAQGFLLTLGAPALWRLAKSMPRLPTWVAPAIPLLYWIHPSVRSIQRFDFHPEFVMVPAFLWMLVYLQEKKWGRMVFCALIALMAKESAAPVLAGIGFAVLAGGVSNQTKKTRWALGTILVCFGLGVFFATQKLVEYAFQTPYAYADLYAHLGNSPLEIIASPLLRPMVFLQSVLTWERAKFFFVCMAPLGFLPLLGWRRLWAALPAFMMLFLAQGTTRVNPDFHYFIEPSIGVFWAFLLGAQANWPARFPKLVPWVLFWALASFGRSDVYYLRRYPLKPELKDAKATLLYQMNPEHTWTVPYRLVPHLATVPWIHYQGRATCAAKLTDRVLTIDGPDDCLLGAQHSPPNH